MKKANKKVWIFHHYATPPTMSGSTRSYNFGVELKKKGYDTKVFSSSYLHYSDDNLIEGKDLYKVNEETEVPFVFVKTFSSSSNGLGRVLNIAMYYINVLKTAKKLIKKGDKPDIIIASSPHPLSMIAGLKIAKKLGIPCINEVRDFWPEVFFLGGKLKENGLIGKILLKNEHWIYEKSDALIFLKEGDYTYLTDRKWDTNQGGEIDLKKCHYINNGVNIEKFEKQRKTEILKDKDLDNDKFKVVYSGAIRPVNDIGKILDTAKLLKDYKDIEFLIYGHGNQFDLLSSRIKDEEITNVKMKGYVEKKDIPYILSKSSVNLLNYSQNKYNWSRGNSSNKLFEYMASGKPIISTVKIGYSPIEKYKCGLTLKENNSKEFAKKILEIYEMPKEEYNEMGNNARKAAEDFDYTILTEKLEVVIKDQLSKKKK